MKYADCNARQEEGFKNIFFCETEWMILKLSRFHLFVSPGGISFLSKGDEIA